MKHPVLFGILLLAGISCAPAQDEATLRRYFEGKPVRVKLDMPGTQQGVDVRWNQDPAVDFGAYSQRMKKFGRSLADGDVVRVTTVRVKQKNIEFQLGGGGYGTLGDDTGSVSTPYVGKTSRERDLEKEVKRETDPRRKDQLNRELSRLESDRRREESYQRSKAAELEQIRRSEIAEKRRQGGSRFNIWFPQGYLTEKVPTPEEMMRMLNEYVDFSPMRGPEPSQAEAPRRQPPPPSSDVQLRKGMSREDVVSVLGRPFSTGQRAEGSLRVETARWESADTITEVEFIDGIVMRFRTSSK